MWLLMSLWVQASVLKTRFFAMAEEEEEEEDVCETGTGNGGEATGASVGAGVGAGVLETQGEGAAGSEGVERGGSAIFTGAITATGVVSGEEDDDDDEKDSSGKEMGEADVSADFLVFEAPTVFKFIFSLFTVRITSSDDD